MLKKFALKFLLVALLLTLYPTGVWAEPIEVSPKEAIAAALFQVVLDQKENNESMWKQYNIHAEEPIPVYDASGDKHSYIVNLKGNNQEKGFVEVSYYKDDFPILSFGYVSNIMDESLKQKLRESINKTKSISSEKVVVKGPGNFGLKIDYTDGTADIIGVKELIKISKEENKLVTKQNRQENQESKKLWKQIDAVTGEIGSDSDGVTDNPGAYESGYSSTNSKLWSGVGDANQYTSNLWTGPSGCAPTSGYNLMYYYHYTKGFSNLLKNSYGYVDKDDSVLLMRQKMSTDNQGSTYISNIDSGLRAYSVARGYSSAASSTTTNPSWYTIKSHLANGPSLISLTNQTFYCGSTSCGHTVTGVGYTEYFYSGSSTGHQYMIVHDNWGSTPESVYIAYGRNYSSLWSTIYSM